MHVPLITKASRPARSCEAKDEVANIVCLLGAAPAGIVRQRCNKDCRERAKPGLRRGGPPSGNYAGKFRHIAVKIPKCWAWAAEIGHMLSRTAVAIRPA
jgi:hypothetical protein